MYSRHRVYQILYRHESLLLLSLAPLLLFPLVAPRFTIVALIILGVVLSIRLFFDAPPWPVTPYTLPLLFLLLFTVVGSLVSPVRQWTIPKLTGLILGMIIFRAVTQHIQRSHEGINVLLIYIGLATIAMTGGVLGTRWGYHKIFFLSTLIGHIMPELRIPIPELPEGYINPNQLATLPLFTLPMLISLLVYRPTRIRQQMPVPIRKKQVFSIIVISLLVAHSIVLFLSLSRSAWMAMLASTAFLFMLVMLHKYCPRCTKVYVWLSWALLLTFLPYIIMSSNISRMWLLSNRNQGNPLMGRQEAWFHAMNALQDFPFTGVGLGAYRDVVPFYYTFIFFRPSQFIADAHNTILQTGVDLGIVGLISYMALTMIALKSCISLASSEDRTHVMIGVGASSTLIGLHTYGTFNTISLGSKPAMLFWMLLGILAGLTTIGRDTHTGLKFEIPHRAQMNYVGARYLVLISITFSLALARIYPLLNTNARNLVLLFPSVEPSRVSCPLQAAPPDILEQLHSPIGLITNPDRAEQLPALEHLQPSYRAAYALVTYIRCIDEIQKPHVRNSILAYVDTHITSYLARYLLDIYAALLSKTHVPEGRVDVLEALLSHAPQHVNGHYYAARLYQNTKQWKEVAYHARYVIDLATSPNAENIRIGSYKLIGISYIKQHAWEKVHDIVEEMKETHCGVRDVRLCTDAITFIVRRMEQEKLREARDVLQEAIRAFEQHQWDKAISGALTLIRADLGKSGSTMQIWGYNVLIRSLIAERRYTEAAMFLAEMERRFSSTDTVDKATYETVHTTLQRLLEIERQRSSR